MTRLNRNEALGRSDRHADAPSSRVVCGCDLYHLLCVCFFHYDTEAYSHVVDLKHFRVTQIAELLQHAENRRNRRQGVNLIADRRGSARQVKKSVAREMDQRLELH